MPRRRDRRTEEGGRRRGRLFVVAALLLAAACAKKPAELPAPTGPPKFADFVFPAPPPNLGAPAVVDQHTRAWQFLQGGDTKTAEREFGVVLKAVPGFYPSEAGLGYAALARKDASEAAEHFDKALASNAAYAPALVGKGEALLSLGRTDAALAAFQEAAAADPSLMTLKSRIDVLAFRNAQETVAAARKAADAGKFEDARRAYQTAIASSPDSAFLYRELAVVERKAGDTASAFAHAQQAVKIDPADTRALGLIAEIHEANREWLKAADAYTRLNAAEPGDAATAKIELMRERAAFDAMPADYRAIDGAPSVTRAQLAALLGVRLEDLLRRARGSNPVLTTDTRTNWAAPWIMSVTRAGVMEPFANHTFQPNAIVRRGDLAQAASRVLTLIAAEKPRLASRWRDPRPKFSDVAPSNLSYPAAARSVSAGVMSTLDGDTFQLMRTVTGSEALDAVSKLEALAKK